MEKIMQNKKIIRIICVAFAALLWMYVSYQENPSMSKTVRNVPIAIAGEQALKENGFSVYSVSEQSVDVKATAKRLSLARMSNKTIYAEINVSSIKKSGTYTLPATVNSSLSSSASYYVKGKDITVVIEPILKKEYDIEANIAPSQNKSIIVKSHSLSSENVSVSAPKSILNDIASVMTEQITPQSDAKNQIVKLIAYAKNGKVIEGVEFNPSEVTLSYSLYDIKTLPIVLKTSNGKTHTLPSQYVIEVYGQSEVLNAISKIETQEIDISSFDANSEIALKLNLPEGIYINNGSDEIRLELKEKYYE